MLNLLLYLPSIFLYKFILASRGVKLRISDVYFLTFILTFLFFDSFSENYENITHAAYISLWAFFYIIGCVLARKTTITSRLRMSAIPLKIVLFLLLLYFTFLFLSNFASIISLDLNTYDDTRQNTQVTYFQYMFSKSLVFFCFLVFFFTSKKLYFKVLLFIMLIVVAALTLQKSIILYALMSIFIYKNILRNKSLDLFSLFKLLTIVIAIGTTISWLIYGADILVTLNAVLKRIFLLPADLTFTTLRMVDERDYLFYGGASVKTLFDLLDLPSIYLGEATYIYYFGHIIDSASANSPMLSAFYADFNLFGLLAALIFGFIFKFLDNYYHTNRMRNTLVFSSAYATLIICTLKFNITNFGTAFLSEGFFATLLIFFLSSFSSEVKFSTKINIRKPPST